MLELSLSVQISLRELCGRVDWIRLAFVVQWGCDEMIKLDRFSAGISLGSVRVFFNVSPSKQPLTLQSL